MIVLKFRDDIKTNKKSFFSFLSRKNITENSITRENVVINQRVFSVITLCKEDIDNRLFQRLININKGKVLETYDKSINDKISSYLYDKKPYCKRALLSGLVNYIESLNNTVSITVLDNDFNICDEYYRLCNCVRSFVLVTPPSASFEQFSENVYLDYGLKVSSAVLIYRSDVTVDFSNMDDNGNLWVEVLGDKKLIYPDTSYYLPDESVSELLKLGVPVKCACAVLK